MKIVIGVVVSFVIFLMLVVGGVAMFGAKSTGGITSTGDGAAVRVHEVNKSLLVESVTAPGRVEPKTNVAISAKVSSRIIELPYAEGERVMKGDPDADPPVPASVLVRLDATDMEAQLQSAQARWSAQQAQIEVDRARIESQKASLRATDVALAEAKRDLERNRELRTSNDISQATLDDAQMRYDELRANRDSSKASLDAVERGLLVQQFNLEAARADIARAEDNLTYTTIKSPIDGVVTALNAEVGELVMTGTMNNPGTVILEVADLSKMLVVVQLDEADVGKVDVGQPAVVRLLAYPDNEYTGAVETIALKATEGQTRFFETKILLDNTMDRIHSGMTADAEIEVARYEDVLTVPSQAVMGRSFDDLPKEVRDAAGDLVDAGKAIITVVYRLIDNKAVVTPVLIGASDLTHTVIKAGLNEGDRVIIGPYKVLESIAHDQAVVDEDEQAKTDADEAKESEKSEPAGETPAEQPTAELKP